MGLEIKKWKVLHSEYLSREPWFTVRREKVELPNGSVIPSYYVLEYPVWICILGITKEGKMVLIRQYRHGLGKVSYELCAGVCDDTDDSYMEAAKRELLEETGFGGGEWEEWMVESANPGTHTNLVHCFYATGLEKVSEQQLEQTEDIVVELLDAAQVKELLLNNEIIQSLHAAPLWRYFALNK